MIQRDQLRELVAEFFETQPEKISPGFPFTGARMEGSVARYALDAAIRRRFGVKCPAVYEARTYGELEAGLCGASPDDNGDGHQAQSSVPASAIDFGPMTPLGCGIDIELVANLPEAGDYWEHEFYRTWFTPAEIAYCIMQENPAVHFAARWCAKEALKKCDARFLETDMSEIEVLRDDIGRITLARRNGSGTKASVLPYAVSISHTPLLAAAVVV